MRAFSLLTTVVCVLSASISAASLSIADVSTKYSTPFQTLLRRDNTPAYDRVHDVHPEIAPEQQYAFMLEWANRGSYISPEIKDYCQILGFKHRALLVGHVPGGGKRPLDFTGKVYQLGKELLDKGVWTGPGESWTPRKETVTYLGLVKQTVTDEQIVAEGKKVIGTQQYRMGQFDCSTFTIALYQSIRV